MWHESVHGENDLGIDMKNIDNWIFHTSRTDQRGVVLLEVNGTAYNKCKNKASVLKEIDCACTSASSVLNEASDWT